MESIECRTKLYGKGLSVEINKVVTVMGFSSSSGKYNYVVGHKSSPFQKLN